uniref:Snake toxin/toxin-like domain-containing protein n=1 Tax=Chelydra serpentina TaxID=8475 RepID=A0A8C3SKI5_CHESE
RTPFFTLLVRIIYAHSLVCFTCMDASSNWGCLAPTICRSGENNCVTEYSGIETGKFGGGTQ